MIFLKLRSIQTTAPSTVNIHYCLYKPDSDFSQSFSRHINKLLCLAFYIVPISHCCQNLYYILCSEPQKSQFLRFSWFSTFINVVHSALKMFFIYKQNHYLLRFYSLTHLVYKLVHIRYTE